MCDEVIFFAYREALRFPTISYYGFDEDGQAFQSSKNGTFEA